MSLEFCPDCLRYHEPGQWECPTTAAEEAAQVPQPDLIPPPRRPSLSGAVAQWTKIYEQYLEEFATETGGAPTVAHVRRAEELADREIRRTFA